MSKTKFSRFEGAGGDKIQTFRTRTLVLTEQRAATSGYFTPLYEH
jgi:hypothetical protein